MAPKSEKYINEEIVIINNYIAMKNINITQLSFLIIIFILNSCTSDSTRREPIISNVSYLSELKIKTENSYLKYIEYEQDSLRIKKAKELYIDLQACQNSLIDEMVADINIGKNINRLKYKYEPIIDTLNYKNNTYVTHLSNNSRGLGISFIKIGVDIVLKFISVNNDYNEEKRERQINQLEKFKIKSYRNLK